MPLSVLLSAGREFVHIKHSALIPAVTVGGLAGSVPGSFKNKAF